MANVDLLPIDSWADAFGIFCLAVVMATAIQLLVWSTRDMEKYIKTQQFRKTIVMDIKRPQRWVQEWYDPVTKRTYMRVKGSYGRRKKR